MTSTSGVVAPSLDGPSWLRARRAAAAEALASRPVPSAEEEVWRYSPIGSLDPTRYRPLGPDDWQAPAALPAAVQAVVARYPRRAALVVTYNGVPVVVEHDAAGLSVTRAVMADTPDAAGDAAEPVDYFALLNDAYALDAVVVSVAAQTEVADPVVVVHYSDAEGRAITTRTLVRLGAAARATVVEHQLSSDDELLVAAVLDCDVARDAALEHVVVQQLGSGTWQIASLAATVGGGGRFTGGHAAFGGHYARTRTDCRLIGRGAEGSLSALYFGAGDQTLDFRTFQDHLGPDTTSSLLFKGAVDDRSRAIYTGLIHVAHDAPGTNAVQTNRNLKLSDDAWAESVPNLEIENNNVRCSHASAVGPVDEEQRFYLESRGVPTAAAERLIVSGFFAEVVRALPVAATRDLVIEALTAKLDRDQGSR